MPPNSNKRPSICLGTVGMDRTRSKIGFKGRFTIEFCHSYRLNTAQSQTAFV